jgi:Dolichyl-phosphate-mannose-protein mannosyltransferase
LTNASRRWLYTIWLLMIGGFAILHALNLRADFPNHSPWFSDWAKYTDEGWYGNAAVRAHLFGHWYLPGDFNPGPAVPVWPFLEWLLFFVTGVKIQAARGLATAFFFVNLVLSYLLLRARGPRWMALMAVTLLVTSPFLYCFSRLAILEPMLTAFALAALNLAIRLPGMRRPIWGSAGIGLLFTLMMLTKTTAIFLLPALGWAMLLPLWQSHEMTVSAVVHSSAGAGPAFRSPASVLRHGLTAAGAFAISFGLWMMLVVSHGYLPDYKYLFFVNNYIKPANFYWPLLSLWWSFHGGLWVDHILIPLAGIVLVSVLLARRTAWGRKLLLDPVFGASVLAVAGYLLFMTYQNHPQPRYFAVVAFFSFFVIAQGAEALLGRAAVAGEQRVNPHKTRPLGWTILLLAALAAVINGVWTMNYASHPEYSFVNAADRLAHYIDTYPNGKRLLVSVSGDEISLITHLPALCDDFGTRSSEFPDLVAKLAYYQPGWYATWNDFDPGTLEDLHTQFSLEQVASFHAFDDPDRNVLVLFKLHPLPGGQVRDPSDQNMQVPLPDDKIFIPIQ